MKCQGIYKRRNIVVYVGSNMSSSPTGCSPVGWMFTIVGSFFNFLLATRSQQQRYWLLWGGNPRSSVHVEAKIQRPGNPVYTGIPFCSALEDHNNKAGSEHLSLKGKTNINIHSRQTKNINDGIYFPRLGISNPI